MPRTAKTSKKIKKQVVTSYSDLEKGLLSAKNDLVKQSAMILNDLTKQQKQVKSSLAKAQSEKKQAKKKQSSLAASAKNSKNKTVQKQLKDAKQAYDVAAKSVDKLQAEHSQVVTQLNQAKIANKKFASLVKVIEKFNQSWEKKSAKMSSGKKRRKIRKTSKADSKTLIPIFSSFETPVM